MLTLATMLGMQPCAPARVVADLGLGSGPSRFVDKDYDSVIDMMATLMNDVGRCYEETVALLCWTSTR